MSNVRAADAAGGGQGGVVLVLVVGRGAGSLVACAGPGLVVDVEDGEVPVVVVAFAGGFAPEVAVETGAVGWVEPLLEEAVGAGSVVGETAGAAGAPSESGAAAVTAVLSGFFARCGRPATAATAATVKAQRSTRGRDMRTAGTSGSSIR